jgi:hypothetical protein
MILLRFISAKLATKSPTPNGVGLFVVVDGFEKSNAARMSAAGGGSTEPNLNFHSLLGNENANESVLPCWTFCRNRRGFSASKANLFSQFHHFDIGCLRLLPFSAIL